MTLYSPQYPGIIDHTAAQWRASRCWENPHSALVDKWCYDRSIGKPTPAGIYFDVRSERKVELVPEYVMLMHSITEAGAAETRALWKTIPADFGFESLGRFPVVPAVFTGNMKAHGRDWLLETRGGMLYAHISRISTVLAQFSVPAVPFSVAFAKVALITLLYESVWRGAPGD